MGILFGIGSICFALGSFRPYFEHYSPAFVAATFFVGSIFFTTASYIQFRECSRASGDDEPDGPPAGTRRRLLAWRPRNVDWWAAAVQLVGTVFFNISTFGGTRTDFDLDQQKHLIWAPDVLGSICFLVASALAFSEVNRGWRPRSDASLGWRIGGLNMLGSVAFGVAAIAARYLPTTGEPANIRLINLGTFAGAICFLVGAALLPVQSARDARTASAV